MTDTIISLFSGLGGYDLAAQRVGLSIVGAYEINPAYCALYERATGLAIQEADLDKIDPAILPDSDGIIGGPPCTAFSSAGLREGTKSPMNMWPATLRIVAAKHPRWFAFENVPAFMREHAEYSASVIVDLKTLGYRVEWRILNAADYGVSQTRQRVFIIGRADDVPIRWPAPTHFKQGIPGDARFPRWVSWYEALSNAGWLANDPRPDTLPEWITRKYPSVGMFSTLPCDGWFPCQETRHDKQHRERWQPSYTIVANTHNRTRIMVDGVTYRADADALAIMQCLPTGIAKTSEPVGNAVPPPLGEAVLKQFSQYTGV